MRRIRFAVIDGESGSVRVRPGHSPIEAVCRRLAHGRRVTPRPDSYCVDGYQLYELTFTSRGGTWLGRRWLCVYEPKRSHDSCVWDCREVARA
jgi:hypothetical protein